MLLFFPLFYFEDDYIKVFNYSHSKKVTDSVPASVTFYVRMLYLQYCILRVFWTFILFTL